MIVLNVTTGWPVAAYTLHIRNSSRCISQGTFRMEAHKPATRKSRNESTRLSGKKNLPVLFGIVTLATKDALLLRTRTHR